MKTVYTATEFKMSLVRRKSAYFAKFDEADALIEIDESDAENIAESEGIDFEDDAHEALVAVRNAILAAFPGAVFAGFADAPDDNSFVNTRSRSQCEIEAARDSAEFRSLIDAGLTDSQIAALVGAV